MKKYYKAIGEFLNLKKIKDLNFTLTKNIEVELEEVIKVYDKTLLNNSFGPLKILLLNNTETDWVGRIKRAKQLTSCTLQWYIELCNDEITAKQCKQNRNKLSSGSLQMYIEKHGIEEGTKKYNKACKSKKGQATEQWYINKYGEEEGKKRWKRIRDKRKTSLQIPKQRNFGHGRTLKGMIERYGEIEGTKLWGERNKRQAYRFSKQWYIDKYGNREGEEKYEEYKSKNDHGSLQYFVQKYGEVEGKKRYERKCKLSNSGGMGLQRCIERWGEDEGNKRHCIWVENTLKAKALKIHYSKISQDLFWNVCNDFDDKYILNVRFAELNGEHMFTIWKEGIKVMFVDFKINNIIIEFQGTYWHQFNDAKERDKKRKRILEEKGYKVLEITEKEYEKSKINTINKCLEFIKNNIV